MITLKTLKKASAQEVFDQVAAHLLTQNARSTTSRGICAEDFTGLTCRYRNPEGLKCAVGCLIDDSEYAPELEGYSVIQLAAGFGAGYEYEREGLRKHEVLLIELQKLHDNHPPDEWPERLKYLAHNMDLEFREQKYIPSPMTEFV